MWGQLCLAGTGGQANYVSIAHPGFKFSYMLGLTLEVTLPMTCAGFRCSCDPVTLQVCAQDSKLVAGLARHWWPSASGVSLGTAAAVISRVVLRCFVVQGGNVSTRFQNHYIHKCVLVFPKVQDNPAPPKETLNTI